MKSDVEKEAGALVLRDYGNFFRTQYEDFLSECTNSSWLENKIFTPIQVSIEPKEYVSVIDLVSSDNTLMTKVLGALSSLCTEVLKLKTEAYESHFKFLSIYEEYKESNIALQIDKICRLSAFVTRCNDTLKNFCSQVFALYTETTLNLNGIQLHYIIKHIAELLSILVLLELLISHTSMPTNWFKYIQSLKNVYSKNNFEFSQEKLKSLIGATTNITKQLMSDNIVQNSLNNIISLRQKLVHKNTSAVANEFCQYIKLAIFNLDKLIQDKPTVNNMYRCVKINVLFILNSHLFGTNDKKIYRSLMELNTKAHSIPIIGTTLWFPEQSLSRYLPSITGQGKIQQSMLRARQSYLTNQKLTLSRTQVTLQNLISQWVLNVENTFTEKHIQLNASEMNTHAKLLLSGLDIASQANHFLVTLINLHLTLNAPLSKTMLISIFSMIESLKNLKNAVTRNHNSIVVSINMVTQHLTFQALSAVLNVKKMFMMDKNYANERLDELTCIVVAERALSGASTVERNVAANIALSFLPNNIYPEDSYSQLGNLLENIYALTNFTTTIDFLCDGSWLFWHQNIIPIYLEKNFLIESDSFKLKHLFGILEDCALLLHSMDDHFGMRQSKAFIDNMQLQVEETIMKSSNHQIETNLRLHIHSHLQLEIVNPFTTKMLKKTLLQIDNFRLLQCYLAVRPSLEHYLSTMYYNLTTVVLSDWKTYGEMRQMAKFKFNLSTVADNLPTQTLEQGLDVLEIMRNIHIFVSKYLYNLNNQIFIEKSSDNKHLNSINITHVANSIRTHGTGIMNTTVNFTYQFLKKKFFTFSQFMYDEHIKSRLIKDLRSYREYAKSNDNMYSYKSADKFNKGIRNLGLAEDGQTYLDLFRDLITQIGNAMGYVRMVRSGGRHCCGDATVFLPSLEDVKSFREIIAGCNIDPSTIQAVENLDDNVGSLITNFTQGTEYFKLLVDVFAPAFRNSKNIHLTNFYVIVPPLTLNFIEHIILSKDKMTKKNKVGAAFTDDGFAMGIAYILKLLDQDSNFESLHWFSAVWQHIAQERSSLSEQNAKGTLQLRQALALTERKLNILEQEFKLLYYSLSSARIFFR